MRIDFLTSFFKALGWDIESKAQKPPHKRDVTVELSPETTGRPHYNFRINGETKFFVEVKAPSVALDNINHTPGEELRMVYKRSVLCNPDRL